MAPDWPGAKSKQENPMYAQTSEHVPPTSVTTAAPTRACGTATGPVEGLEKKGPS